MSLFDRETWLFPWFIFVMVPGQINGHNWSHISSGDEVQPVLESLYD